MLTSRCVVVLIVEVCEWRNVEVGEVGDEVRVVFAGALVWGDVVPPNSAAVALVRKPVKVPLFPRTCEQT